ncbi:MAG: hypothetical protein H6R26_2810 [Proteobacteria bacterium]|nr:hypothetical protein [Pseudomonadota bacterium]
MAAPPHASQHASSERRFFGGMALAIMICVFIGFARSFYLKPIFTDWPVPFAPFFMVHGLEFTAWVLLLLVQTTLIARERIDLHRKTGTFGAALAIAMVVLGVWGGALIAANRPTGFVGVPVPPLQFLAVPLFAMALFFIFVALAVALRRNAQSHKRLMMLASVQLVTAAIARRPVIADYGPPAFFGITDLFIVALAIRDFRARGRLHPVTLFGGLLTIASQPGQRMLSGPESWLSFARCATGLLG